MNDDRAPSEPAQDQPAEPMGNEALAEHLVRVAELLEKQDANPFRVRAYRTAADVLRRLREPAHQVLATKGAAGLLELPGIGESLARSIERLIRTGRLGLLERLQGELEATDPLTTVAGIGAELARRIHERLSIDTLEDLEMAASDGRLARVPGMGRKRVRAVRESLAGRFRRPIPPSRFSRPSAAVDQPGVAELMDVDREYREKARQRRLPRIAPRRFNPTAEAWLPVLHTQRDGRQYTALYSNTARAHELGMVQDWVVIYRDDNAGDGQWTVITSRYGHLQGRRVVRGREDECRDYYGLFQRSQQRDLIETQG